MAGYLLMQLGLCTDLDFSVQRFQPNGAVSIAAAETQQPPWSVAALTLNFLAKTIFNVTIEGFDVYIEICAIG